MSRAGMPRRPLKRSPIEYSEPRIAKAAKEKTILTETRRDKVISSLMLHLCETGRAMGLERRG